jgi:2-(1,2-epoxy-1,2-dihydrophenyl)acetyl-CoA isomerase
MDAVTYEVDGHVAVITLNQPERRNALSAQMSRELGQAWVRAAADRTLRVVIITGAGDTFCAGADAERLASAGARGGEENVSPLEPDPQYATVLPATPPHLRSRHLFAQALPIPVIAAVNGLAIGAGLALALSADIRIGSRNAGFQAGFVRIGAAPELGLSWTVNELIGLARARDLLLSGRRIGADEALQWGLMTQVAPDDQLMAHCRELAAEMARRNSPHSIRLAKTFLGAAPTQSFAEALETSRVAAGPAMRGPHFEEGVAALRERRLPVWPADPD